MNEKDTMNNKCPSCNASITWNIKENKFKCDYCASTYTLEEVKEYNASLINEKKEEPSKKLEENKSTVIENKSTVTEDNLLVYKCKNCGAEIITDENTVSTFCIYCGSTAILREKLENGIHPDYIIPFTKTEEDAKNAYRKLLEKKIFLPKKFKDEKNIEKIRGIYVPFWAYDITYDGTIDFDCEDRRTWEDDEYEYEEIKSYDVTIKGHYDFEKILCDASENIKDEMMDSIAPFDLGKLEKYEHAYLSGYLTDKYDVSVDESYKIAEERGKNSVIRVAGRKTGHQSEMHTGDALQIEKKKSYYIYLPVYFLNTKFEDKMYAFSMNGQTGKIVGDLPMDKLKFTIATILVFVLTYALIILIIMSIGG